MSNQSSIQPAIEISLGGGAYSDVSIEREDGEDLSDAEIEEIQSAE